MKNYYEILQISKNASPELVKAAYTVLIKKYHPDNNAAFQKEATAMTNEILEAYSVLSNPIKRADYDAFLNQQEPSGNDNRQKQNIHSSANCGKEKKFKVLACTLGVTLLFSIYFSVIQNNANNDLLVEVDDSNSKIVKLEQEINDLNNEISKSQQHIQEVLDVANSYNNVVIRFKKLYKQENESVRNLLNELYKCGYSLYDAHELTVSGVDNINAVEEHHDSVLKELNRLKAELK